MTSEEDVEEDPASPPDGSCSGGNRPASHGGSSDSHHHDDVEHDEYSHNSASFSGSEENGVGPGDDDRNSIIEDFEEEEEEEEEEDEEEDDDDDLQPPPGPFSQHAFAPPFYGRPPTPLPPSPSLTSLLRPSRPTTPDASDDEHPGEPLPRARPKVPTYEYYGFVLYLFSSLSFLIYLLWSYLPSPFLHALGIYYYPNRWWSLAIPSFLVMTLVYIYVALAAYNTEILTLPLESVETIVDEAAQVAVVDSKGRIKRERRRGGVEGPSAGQAGGGGGKGMGKGRGRGGAGAGAGEDDHEYYYYPSKDGGGKAGRVGGRERNSKAGGGLNWKEVWNEGTDAVMDVPLAGVCEVLYAEGREWESEEDDEVMITRL
ncbi:PIG-P-domain-containing protein [Canariomyces notabilis]|uniref:PIG-P-domain-containing protein n=1 Tax=Canariomyces notabilis TaxID=2074819 RepID=A0AAN6TKV8_9PEZI|nr:PIG-P-domain-containing protein [Canariomyces arenarius]